MFSVYRITNTITGEAYIGFTSRTIERRFAQHKRAALRGSQWLLHVAIRLYGMASFEVETLVVVETREKATALEMDFIAECETRAPCGYNMTDGGDGALGYRHTEEFKTSVSQRLKGVKRPPKIVEGMRQRMIGWVPSDKTRERMRQAQRGRKHRPETLQKMSEAAVRRWQENPTPMTPERIARLQTLAVGLVRTLEHKAAIGAALKGKPKSPEHKAKLATAAKLREERKRLSRETP